MVHEMLYQLDACPTEDGAIAWGQRTAADKPFHTIYKECLGEATNVYIIPFYVFGAMLGVHTGRTT